MTNFHLKKASENDAAIIWEILQFAIESRKKDGSEQWQNGYPNPDVVREDIANGHAFLFYENDEIAACCALIINDEPAYDNINGEWLSDGNFVVVHRVAVREGFGGKGISGKLLQEVENFAKKQNIFSIKIDTNFDNIAMLKTIEKNGYSYCGKVILKGGEREKVIVDEHFVLHVPEILKRATSLPTSVTRPQDLKQMEIPRRSVQPRDVEIDILYCGVCHSDLHTARNP